MNLRTAGDPTPMRDDEEWRRRRPANRRLGIALGVLALLVFLLAFWKFRPM